MNDLSEFRQVAALFFTVMATARLTRLVVFDKYPPVAWLRIQWDNLTDKSPWNLLLKCGYCFAPWVALVVGGAGYFSEWHWVWWMITGWLTVAYLGAIVTAYDGDD
jgi:hypothetical protein